MLRPCLLSILAAVALATVSDTGLAAPSASVAVTSCGQMVPPKTTGYLTGDLDCTGFTGLPAGIDPFYQGAAVYLGQKSALDLRGFTLTGGQWGVVCRNLCGRAHCAQTKCEVFGGSLTGSENVGIAGEQLTVHDVTVTGFGVGVYSYGKSRLTSIDVSGSIDDCVRTGNTRMLDATLTGCGGAGIAANANHTVMKIKSSTILTAANSSYCIDDPAPCSDIYTDRRPKLVSTTCNTSGAPVSINPAGTWGVCTLD